MAFIEKSLPTTMRRNLSVAPTFQTGIVSLRGGGEFRTSRWSDPLRAFETGYAHRSTETLEDEITSFVYEMKGSFYGFRAKDWSDYQCTNEQIATGNGTDYYFRMQKSYGDVLRRILKPIGFKAQVFVNSVPAGVDDFFIDEKNGVVVFRDPPTSGDVITWSGEFDVPVRFDEDAVALIMRYKDVGESGPIGLREIRITENISEADYDAARALLVAQGRSGVAGSGIEGFV